jgi:predicted negative regulator of RcsB-dependent stress response
MAQSHPSGEDQFVTTTLQILAWAQKNTRALILGAGTLAIAIFAVKYYLDYQNTVQEAASSEIRTIRFQMQSGSSDQSIERLRTFMITYDGTVYAQEARILLAQSLLESGRTGEAIEPASQAISDLKDDVLSGRAAFLLAAAYEEVADTNSAIQTYERIGNDVQQRVQRSRALQAAARLREGSGDYAGAAAIYAQLLEFTPEDVPAHAFYRMRITEMRTAERRVPQMPAEVEGG